MRTDVAIGAGLLAAAAGYWYLTLNLPVVPIEHTLGPAFLPKLLTGLLSLLALLLILQTWRRPAGRATSRFPGAIGRASLLIALMAAYAAGMAFLGYFLTTPFFLAGTIWLAGERGPVRLLLGTATLFAVIQILFRILFKVPLPLGPLD